jgi:hypothetical protein
MADFFRKLLTSLSGADRPHPLDAADASFQPDPSSPRDTPPPVYPKVLVIIHNPICRTQGGKTLREVCGWNDPDALASKYIDDIQQVSGGYAKYQIVERIEVDGFPLKKDGFRYDERSFLGAWKSRQFHQPDAVDYLALVDEFRMIERVNSGQIDEVWLLGFPYCGYYESIMAGPGAFWCNAPPLERTGHAARRFVIMGFNYERGVGEMLEDLGHRAESMLSQVFKPTRGDTNLWERFTRYDKTHPGAAECGNVHFAPNSTRDYDWGNPRPVPCRAHTWKNFPDLAGAAQMMDCRAWGDGDIRLHHLWWFDHMPRIVGESGGIAWNWWEYIIDPNRVR